MSATNRNISEKTAKDHLCVLGEGCGLAEDIECALNAAEVRGMERAAEMCEKKYSYWINRAQGVEAHRYRAMESSARAYEIRQEIRKARA